MPSPVVREIVCFFEKRISIKVIGYNIVQTGLLMTISDLIAQMHLEKKEKIDWKRTGRFAELGIFLIGPFCSLWVQFLDSAYEKESKLKNHRLKIALKKMFLDQLIFAPTMMAFVIYKLSQNDAKTSAEKRIKTYFDLLLRSYTVWPVIQFTNFLFVPLKKQVFVSQSCGLVWNTYISWRANNLDK